MPALLAAWLLVCLPTLATAEEDDAGEPEEFGRTGAYVALLAGYAHESANTITPYGIALSLRSSGTAQVGFRGGYRLHPPLAVELQLDYRTATASTATLLGSAAPLTAPVGRSASAELDALSVTPNIRIYLLPGRIQPYAVVGIGLFWSEVGSLFSTATSTSFTGYSETSFLLRAGGGVAVQLTDQIALELGAEYMRPDELNESLRHVSFTGALLYRF